MPDHNRDSIAEQREAIERMFSAIAPRYDALNRLLSAGRDRAWRREAVRAARLPVNGRLLDVCTGTADVALEAARQCPGARIVGVDFSGPMIALGRQKVIGEGRGDRVALSVAPAEALPFAEEIFDAATVAFGLRNVPDRRQALVEMHRVLRPGGRVVVLEFTTPPGRLFRTLYLWYFHRVLPRIGGWISGHRTAYAYLPASVGEFPSPDGVVTWLRDAGFREVSYRLMTLGIVAIHVGMKGSG